MQCSRLAGRIVKLSTLALDFDGTIARNDVLDPAVRESIAAVREQGIVVVLVQAAFSRTYAASRATCTSSTPSLRRTAP